MRVEYEKEWHTFTTHGNGVGYADRVVLPREHVLSLDRVLDSLGKI